MAELYTVTREDFATLDVPIHQQTAGSGGRWGVSLGRGGGGYAYARLRGDAVYMSVPNVKPGIMTSGLNGCVGLVYAFRNSGAYKLIMLAHVNCGDYSDVGMLQPPMSVAKVQGFTADETWVVAAVPPKQAHMYDLDYLTGGGLRADHLFVYEGRDSTFFITTEGVAGENAASSRASMDVMDAKESHSVQLLSDQSSSGGGGFCSWCCCYITSATCLALGRGDDCRELRALRWFRDTIMLASERGRLDAEAYYRTAPAIVAAIEGSGERYELYHLIFAKFIRPAVVAVELGRYSDAWSIYRRMVLALCDRFDMPRPRISREERWTISRP